MGEVGRAHAPDQSALATTRPMRRGESPARTDAPGAPTPEAPLSGAMVLGLQQSAGNAAVSAMVSRTPPRPATPSGARHVQRVPPTHTQTLPHFAEGQGTVSTNGQYLIWGTWRAGDDYDGYLHRVFDLWVTWRFGGGLSGASRGQMLQRLYALPYRVLEHTPTSGHQYYTTIDRLALQHLLGIAERDPQARQAEAREQASGLSEGPPMAETSADASTHEQAPPQQQAAQPSGSEFEGGRHTATDPALPASLTGPDIQPTRSIGTYTMRLDYSFAGPDQLSQLAEAMRGVFYHWELFRVTELILTGMGDQIDRQRQRPVSSEARIGRLDPAARHAEQAVDTLSDETSAAAGELLHPVDAAHGGTPVDVVTRAEANLTSLELLPASAIVSMGGVALGAIADIFGGDRHEQEVPLPGTPGYYLVRCIAQQRAGERVHRAASVAIKLVQVRPVSTLARAAVELPHARVAEKELELELARRQGATPERLMALERELADLRTTASGAASDVIALRIRETEAELAATPDWRRGDVERRLEKLREQQEHAQDRAAGMRGQIWRPEGAIVSRLDGQTYPLLLQLGRMAGAEGEVWRLSDVSTSDGRQWIGRGASATEAVQNATRLMARGNGYGPGTLAIRFPGSGPFDATEITLDNVNTGTALARRRLADLAAALAVLGLFVPGVGQVAAILGAAIAADRIIDRWRNGSLRLDADTISDIVTLFASAAQGVSAIGRMRVLRLADRFVLASSTAEEEAILGAMRTARTIEELAGQASELANWGGFAFGEALTLNGLMELNQAEISGSMSHAEARRRRAELLLGAVRDATLQFAPQPEGHARGEGEGAGRPEPTHGGPQPGERPVSTPEPAHPAPQSGEHPASGPDPGHAPATPAGHVVPPEPGRLAALEPELGDLAGSVPLVENPALGGSVLVRYRDGELHMEIGPRAGARQVRAHTETARLLRRYEGPIGVMRQLIDRIGTLLRLSPGYGTRGFESRLEVRKLREIKTELEGILHDIDVRAERMSGEESADPAEREAIQRELEAIEAQLAEHQALVDSYDPGSGFVAALDEATMRHFGAQERELRTIVRALNRAMRPDLVAVMANVARREAGGGNIRGFAAWVAESVNRSRGVSQEENLGQAVDKATELAEVWRLSEQVRSDPSSVVRFNPGGSGGRSFDIHVEGGPGSVPGTPSRQVEVWEHAGIPVGSRSMNEGIIHGASKIPATSAGPPGRGNARTEPVHEATVSVEWFPTGSRDLQTVRGGWMRVSANGDYQPLGGTPRTPRGTVGSLPADLFRDLRAGLVGPGVDRLDAINVTTQGGQLLWRFVNVGTAAAPVWERRQ